MRDTAFSSAACENLVKWRSVGEASLHLCPAGSVKPQTEKRILSEVSPG